jgi:hypothetical protein
MLMEINPQVSQVPSLFHNKKLTEKFLPQEEQEIDSEFTHE